MPCRTWPKFSTLCLAYSSRNKASFIFDSASCAAGGGLCFASPVVRDLEDGRVMVHGDDRCMADRSFRCNARPAHNQRNADSTFVQRALARPQRRIIGYHRVPPDVPAVIGRKDYNRAIGEAGLIQMVQHSPHIVVEVLKHSGVCGITMFVLRLQLALEVVFECGRRLDRRVHRMVPEVQEEGPVLDAVDHTQGLVRQPVGQILARLTEFQMRNVAVFLAGASRSGVRNCRVASGSAPQRAADIHVETLRFGIVFGGAQCHFPIWAVA